MSEVKLGDERLVFVDVETTGLDEKEDLLLEVGLVVTDEFLTEVAHRSMLIINENWRAKIAGNKFVFDMHTKSRLINDLDRADSHFHSGSRGGSSITKIMGHYGTDNLKHEMFAYDDPAVAAWMTFKWLTEELLLEPGVQPMVGSSVQFDRKFLQEKMPVLETFFSYRNIDISTNKEQAKRFNKQLAASMATVFSKENAVHRSIADARSSIEEQRYYLHHFLRPSDDWFRGAL